MLRQVSCYTLLSGFQLPWQPSCIQQPIPIVGSDKLLDSLISLSPQYPNLAINLHVRIVQASTGVFSGFTLFRHSSPSFGSQQIRSSSYLPNSRIGWSVIRPARRVRISPQLSSLAFCLWISSTVRLAHVQSTTSINQPERRDPSHKRHVLHPSRSSPSRESPKRR